MYFDSLEVLEKGRSSSYEELSNYSTNEKVDHNHNGLIKLVEEGLLSNLLHAPEAISYNCKRLWIAREGKRPRQEVEGYHHEQEDFVS
jgi:hypothetical protein